ncbi:unnamed protein product [Lampetra fluviatilis]
MYEGASPAVTYGRGYMNTAKENGTDVDKSATETNGRETRAGEVNPELKGRKSGTRGSQSRHTLETSCRVKKATCGMCRAPTAPHRDSRPPSSRPERFNWVTPLEPIISPGRRAVKRDVRVPPPCALQSGRLLPDDGAGDDDDGIGAPHDT